MKIMFYITVPLVVILFILLMPLHCLLQCAKLIVTESTELFSELREAHRELWK